MLLTCVHHEFWGRKTRFSSVSLLVEIDYQLDLLGCQLVFENNSHLLFALLLLSIHIVFLPLEQKLNQKEYLFDRLLNG